MFLRRALDPPRARRLLSGLTVAAACLLFAWHFSVVARTAVNVPYWDDWEALEPGGLPSGLTLAWVLGRENDSRIAPTKLQVWALYKLAGWDLRLQQLMNFGLYGLLLLMAARLGRTIAPDMSPGTLAAFMLFLLSTANKQNHSFAVQSCFHFSVLFFLAAVQLLFREDAPPGRVAAGAAAALLAVASHANGFVTAAVLLASYCAFRLSRLAGEKDPDRRRSRLMQLAAFAAVVTAALVLWLAFYQKPAGHPQRFLPASWRFWQFYANLVSFGFGMNQLSMSLGLSCLAVAVLPVAGEAWRCGRRMSAPAWAAATVIAAMLAVLGSIAYSRAWFELPWTKASRYAGFSTLLVPFSALAWHIRLRAKPGARRLALAGLWLFCFLGFSDNWDFSVYDKIAAERREGLACVRSALAGFRPGPSAAGIRQGRTSQTAPGQDGAPGRPPGPRRGRSPAPPVMCPTIYPLDLRPKLEAAKALDLSFIR